MYLIKDRFEQLLINLFKELDYFVVKKIHISLDPLDDSFTTCVISITIHKTGAHIKNIFKQQIRRKLIKQTGEQTLLLEWVKTIMKSLNPKKLGDIRYRDDYSKTNLSFNIESKNAVGLIYEKSDLSQNPNPEDDVPWDDSILLEELKESQNFKPFTKNTLSTKILIDLPTILSRNSSKLMIDVPKSSRSGFPDTILGIGAVSPTNSLKGSRQSRITYEASRSGGRGSSEQNSRRKKSDSSEDHMEDIKPEKDWKRKQSVKRYERKKKRLFTYKLKAEVSIKCHCSPSCLVLTCEDLNKDIQDDDTHQLKIICCKTLDELLDKIKQECLHRCCGKCHQGRLIFLDVDECPKDFMSSATAVRDWIRERGLDGDLLLCGCGSQIADDDLYELWFDAFLFKPFKTHHVLELFDLGI
jgi:hypothetical protein